MTEPSTRACVRFRSHGVSPSAELSKNTPKTSRDFGQITEQVLSKNANKVGGFVKNQKRLFNAEGSVKMKIQLWLRVTSILIFLQIALGGLLTFSFITALPHIITGFAVLAFAIVTLVMAQTLKPPFRPLQGLSVGLVLLIVVQIILGFTTLSTGNQVVAWVHLLVAMGIYGMAIAGTFMSMRLDYRSREQSVPSAGPQP